MLITIYDSTGTPKAELSPNDSSTQVREIQGDSILTLSFTHYDHISLDVDDYVDFEGERFWVTEKYRPRQNARKEWVYDIKLYGVESMLKRFLVIKAVDDEEDPVFTLTAPPREHVAMIVKCMNNGLGNITDWKVGQVDGTENIVVDYFGKYCDEALREIAGKVGAEAWVDGETVNICKCEHGEPIAMGYEKGLLSIDPGTADNVKFYTRLYPVGSSRNIDREKYGHGRLQLPGGRKYVEMNADKYGRVDHYEADAFADIYPRRTGIVSEVRSEVKTGEDGNPFTIYYFKDNGLDFDPNDYEIGGLVKRVSFQEGSELAGLGEEDNGTYYFEVNFNSSTREFEIITIWPYDNDMQLPGDRLVPKAGDRYILWNISMPEEYYALAEAEFLAAVERYNAEHNLDIAVYKAPTDHVWIEDNDVRLSIGQRIRLESEEYFPGTGYRESRITRITRKVNLPSSMDIEISDALSRTAQEKMSDSIDDVRSYARSISESVNLPDIIGTGDMTRPTDKNLLSALRAYRDLLRKDRADRTRHILASDEGFEVGEFLAGVSGAMVGKEAETGKTFAEVDYLYARVKAYFESLTIIEANNLAGKQYITPGGGIRCVKVEEVFTSDKPDVPAGWRCYFLSEQEGEKSYAKIIAGDQAICEQFNVEPGVSTRVRSHYYWRLVTAVSQDAFADDSGNRYGYIELSASDCDGGSDAPRPGDDICQLGNREDATRQAAMVFSTVDADSPGIKLFKGIDSYSLEGKDIISYGYDTVKGNAYFNCYGDTYTGARDASSFIEFDEQAKEVRLHNVNISVGSKIGDKPLGSLIEDIDASKYLRDALPQSTTITNGLVLTSAVLLGYDNEAGERVTMAGHNGLVPSAMTDPARRGRTIASFWGGPMVDRFYDVDGTRRPTPLPAGYDFAASLVRMDGSAYWAKGNIGFEADGSAWLGNYEHGFRVSPGGSITLGSGVNIDLGGSEKGLQSSLESILRFQSSLEGLLVPTDANDDEISWEEAFEADEVNGGYKAKALKSRLGLWTPKFLSARGKNPNETDRPVGIDEASLASYLTNNNYARKSDIPSLVDYLKKSDAVSQYQPKGNYLTPSALTGYATEQWVLGKNYLTEHQDLSAYLKGVDAASTYLAKTEAASTYVAKVTGKGLSANDFTDTLLAKLNGIQSGANKYVHPTHTVRNIAAAVGLVLSSVAVDAEGHVTDIAAKQLTASDIPTLAISKISGLQSALDSKLNATTFNEFKTLFETYFTLEDENGVKSIKANYGFWSPEYVSARGKNPDETDRPVGIDEAGLEQYLTTHNYARKSDIPSLADYLKKSDAVSQYQPKGKYLTPSALTGYATEQWVLGKKYLTEHQDLSAYLKGTDAASTYLAKTEAASTYVAKVAGKGLSTNDFTDDLLTKLNGIEAGANKYIHPTHTVRNIAAAVGLVLSSVAVDAEGHVTDIAAKQLTASDIPTLAISKISGLQSALDSKLDATTFNEFKTLFETYFTLEDENGVKSIKANYGFWTPEYLSARGKNPNETDRPVGIDEAGLEQYLTTHNYARKSDIPSLADYLKKSDAVSQYQPKGNYLTPSALTGYATEQWVLGKNYLTEHQDLTPYLTKSEAQGLYLTEASWIDLKDIPEWIGATKPSYSFSEIGSKPTTLAGYGITNAYTKTEADNRYVNVDGDTMTGALALPRLSIVGTAASDAYLTADTAKNAFMVVSGRTIMTWDGAESCVRPGNGYHNTFALGKAAARWSNVYATTINVTSTDVVSNLNADMLDGWHRDDIRNRMCGYELVEGTATAQGYDLDTLLQAGGMTSQYSQINRWQHAPTGMRYGSAVCFRAYGTDTLMGMLAWDVDHAQAEGKLTGNLWWRAYAIKANSAKAWGQWEQVAFVSSNVASASKLANARTLTIGLTGKQFDGTANVSWSLSEIGAVAKAGDTMTGLLTLNAGAKVVSGQKLTIGDCEITWDSSKGMLKFSRGIYSESAVSARGANPAGGGTGSGFGRLDNWADYNAKGTDALSATLGYGLRSDISGLATRVASLEGGSALSVTTTGSGNAITSISKSGTTITATKGTTFLTSHQALDHINSLGRLTMVTGTTEGTSGLRLYEVYSNGYPTSYGNLLRVVGYNAKGHGELLLGWTGDTTTGEIYYRSKRDMTATAWSGWVTLATKEWVMPNFVHAYPNTTSVNMNTAASYGNAMGMLSLTGEDKTANPNGQTSWHHFINMSYTTSSTNMWQTQIAVKAGTTDLWVRSRSGGTVVAGTDWTAPWTRILTGSNYTNVVTTLRDRTNGTATYLNYGAAGISNPSWLAAWNGYELRAISPANVLSAINALPRTGGSMANTTVVTNLNADLLDGVHNGSLTANKFGLTGITDLNEPTAIDEGITLNKFDKNAANKPAVVDNANCVLNIFSGLYGTSGRYGGQFAVVNNGRLYWRNWVAGAKGAWNTIAYLTDNVASATRLQGSYSLWGQTFYGNNVSGDMTGVGSIAMSKNINMNTGSGGFDQGLIITGKDYKIGFMIGEGNSNRGIYDYTNGGWLIYRGAGTNVFIPTGNVGICTTTPAYRLDVNGSAIVRGWLRTTGTNGWYSETYGGGWYMSDTSWIRGYNGKSLYMGNGQIRTDYFFSREGYAGTSWGEGYGAYNVQIADNKEQTPLLLAFRSGQSPSVTGTNRLYSMELLNSGGELRHLFGGQARQVFYSSGSMRLSSSMANEGGDVALELWRGTNASFRFINSGGILHIASNYTDKVGGWYDCMTINYNSGNTYIKGAMAIGTTTFINESVHLRKHLVVGNASVFFTATTNGTGKGMYLVPGSDGSLNIYAHESRAWKSSPFKFSYDGEFYAKSGAYSDGYISARGKNTSDIRLKTDVRDFRATDIIMRLRPKAFRWNALARSKFKVFDTDEVQYGLIAQEVKETDPWLVDEDMFHDGLWGVHYDKTVPVMMQCERELVQETYRLNGLLVDVARKADSHGDRIRTLEESNRRLKHEIRKLKRKIVILERR